MSRPLTWMYRKLGRHYPGVLRLAGAAERIRGGGGSVALFSFYYSLSKSEFLQVLAIALGLTAVGVASVLIRVLRRLRPLKAWIGGAPVLGADREAWHLAVNMPMRADPPGLPGPDPGHRRNRHRLDRGARSELARLLPDLDRRAASRSGYAAILHYLALELAMRPILFDINAELDMPVRIDRPVVPLRVKLLGSLPLINVITGIVVAALTSNGGGTDALGVNVLIALFVSFTISFELVVLLSRSILRPGRGPRGRHRAHPPGPLRRARAGDHLGRVRRALLGVQPDGRRAGRARAAARGVRHLPGRGGGRAPDQRGLRAARDGGRGLAGLLRRPELHHRRRGGRRPRGGRAAERALRVHRPDRRPPPRPHRPVHRGRGARRLRGARAGARSTPTAPCSARSSWPGRSTAAGRAASRWASASTRATWSPERSAVRAGSPSA